MISISILNIKDDIEKIDKVDNLGADYIHMDIMDGKFVSNTTDLLNMKKTNTKRDVHLMVYDVKKYIDEYLKFEPEYITFHYEAVDNVLEIIDYIKSKNIKVGLSIKPNTSVDNIEKYLDKVDLVLVMSVEPGKGGQSFIEDSTDKINLLHKLREENNYHYLIEVDGGVKDTTKQYCLNADILVVGSFITMSDNMLEKYDQVKDN